MTRITISDGSPITCPKCASQNVQYLSYQDGPSLDVIRLYECESCLERFHVFRENKPLSSERRGAEGLKTLRKKKP
jgi:hypothetical protein